MVKINFSIPQQLNKKIEDLKKEKGFMSKSEFFRYVMINYIEKNEKPRFEDDEEIENLVRKIETKIKDSGNLSSLKEQLGVKNE